MYEYVIIILMQTNFEEICSFWSLLQRIENNQKKYIQMCVS